LGSFLRVDLVFAASSAGGAAGGASGSGLLLESLLELLEPLEPASGRGGDCRGNGCSSVADGRGELGFGASGGASDGAMDLLGSPGNGKSSAAEGFFVSAGGEQGLSVADWPLF